MIHSVQSNNLLNIGIHSILVGFTDDLNLVDDNKETVLQNTKTLTHETKLIGLDCLE